MWERCVGPGCVGAVFVIRWCLAWFVTRFCTSVRHLLAILGSMLGKASRFYRVICLRLASMVCGVVAFNGDVWAILVFVL